MVIIPVAGAVIGGCVGGPVGLFLGAKVGMAAALGASVVGTSFPIFHFIFFSSCSPYLHVEKSYSQ